MNLVLIAQIVLICPKNLVKGSTDFGYVFFEMHLLSSVLLGIQDSVFEAKFKSYIISYAYVSEILCSHKSHCLVDSFIHTVIRT